MSYGLNFTLCSFIRPHRKVIRIISQYSSCKYLVKISIYLSFVKFTSILCLPARDCFLFPENYIAYARATGSASVIRVFLKRVT
jgi:hypothetical protein